jgi:hypothetical protein
VELLPADRAECVDGVAALCGCS